MKSKKLCGSLYLFWLFQPLILWSVGALEFQKATTQSLFSILLRYFFFGAGLHVVLIGPLIYFAYPDIKKIKVRSLRELSLFGFLALPILSFGYFVSQVNHAGALFDLIFPTLAIIFIAVHLFERTQSLTWLSLGLSTSLYVQWFVVSDILGPFKTPYQMIPTSDLFYWARTLLIVSALGLALWKSSRKEVVIPKYAVVNQMAPMILWMFVGVLLYFALPWALSSYEKDTTLSLNVTDFLFCLIPLWVLFELRPSLSLSRVGKSIQWGIAMLFLAKAVTTMALEPATFFNMSWTAFYLITVVTMGERLNNSKNHPYLIPGFDKK